MRGGPSRATVAAAGLVLVLALATSARAWMAPDPRKVHDGKLGISGTGAMSIEDSREEAAILSAPALAPGAAAVGTVTIRNHGDAGKLVLSQQRLTEVPGAGGASLAEALRLTIRNLSAPAPTVVYSGPLAAMPPLRLGPLASAGKRRYRFVAALPDPGLPDNALMGARVRFDYRWRIRPKP